MSQFASGSIVEQESSSGIAGLNIDIEDVSQVHDAQLLNKTPFVTDTSGKFNIGYADYAFDNSRPGEQARNIQLTVRLGRHVLKQVVLNEGLFGETIQFDPVLLTSVEVQTWRATLGTGKETRTSTGNAVRWLADNVDGWSRAAAVIKGGTTLDVMQLAIDVGDFKQDNPIIVLDFDPADNEIVASNFVVSNTDDRIEKALLAAATKTPVPVDVRVQIPRMSFDESLLKNIALKGAGVALALGLVGIFLVGGILGIIITVLAGIATFVVAALPAMPDYFSDWYQKQFEALDLQKWFDDAKAKGNDTTHVRVRQLVYRSFNIAHAKVVIDRGTEAVLLGSPFEQAYFDSPEHAISSTKRGKKASKGPIHDVSVAVRGPALKDFQDLFNSHWKIAEPTDTLPDPTTPDAATAGADEFNSTVQLVLTLDRMFSGSGETDGEKGILEAYLRAIHFAQRFIYIENQYFHHPIVTQAIIDALLANPNLVVILLLNISPDMPYYLRWQRQRLKSIADALKKQNPGVDPKTRLRVFSSFSHTAAADSDSKPRLLDNYLHTKTAIVDNKFAMVGSANLDGASMDAEDYAKSSVDGEVRHTEADVLVYEDTPVDKSAVDALRRRLWSEHLGILDTQGALDVGNASLDDSPTKNWLTVWSQAADAKLSSLKADKNKVSQVHILPVDFDYGADADGLNILTRTYRDFYVAGTKDHYALQSYLDNTFKQDKTTTVTSKDFDLSPPPNFVFAYAQHTG